MPENWPAFHVGYFDAIEFANWLSRRDRLPTEAEWEYAARAGNRDDHIVLSKDPAVIDQVGWYAGNSDGRLHEIGLKESNSFGIHDMIGNVVEWTWDFYQPDYYSHSPQVNPVGPNHGEWTWAEYAPERTRVRRGSAYPTPLQFTPPYYRGPSSPNDRFARGIRLVRSAD
ncbi:MAG: formylglycine-generating enzyme family protein [Spirochaetales bacterium]